MVDGMGRSTEGISGAWEIEDWQEDVKIQRLQKASEDAREVVELMGRIEAWA